MIILANDAVELGGYLKQLHDTCNIMNNKFTAQVHTPWGVRTLAGVVPAKGEGHRDTVNLIGDKHIKLKP